MNYKLWLPLLTLSWIAALACALLHLHWPWTAACCALALIFTILLFRSVFKPLMAVENGIYLLRSQDFSSALRPTGERTADQVVSLFNTLIGTMKAERLKLQEQSRLLSLLIEASPMGVAICDFDNHIISRNKAFSSMVDDSTEASLLNMDSDTSVTIRLNGGSMVCRCSALWFMDSGFCRRFILVEPLTDEILAAEKRVFTRIIRTIGHEVNNTLGSMVSVLDTLHILHASDPDIEPVIASSIDSCIGLSEFVRGYASLVKLPEPEFAQVDLSAMLTAMLPSLRSSLPSNIALDLSTSGQSFVMADEMLLRRVVENIVKNAAESIGSRPDGRIDIAVTPRALSIADNGPGIAPEAAAQLFTPFFSTKRADRGLGLMLVADILRSHRASYSLATSATTRLTTFSITFP